MADVTAAEFAARGARAGQGADRRGPDAGRPDRDHGADDVRVDAPGLRGLGGGPGHRPRLPDLLRLPDPLDPPGLGRGGPRRGDGRARPPPSAPSCDRIPDLQPHVGLREGPPGAARRAGPGRAGPGSRRTAGGVGPRHPRHPHLHLGHDRPPQGLRAHPRQLLRRGRQRRSNSSTPSSARGRTRRPPPCSSSRSPTSSAAWWRSPVCGRGSASATRRASARRTSSPTWQSFRPTFLLLIPYVLEKVFNTARAAAETHGPRVLVRPGAPPSPAATARPSRREQHGTGPGPSAFLKAARTFYDPLVYRRIRKRAGRQGPLRHLRRQPPRPPPRRLLRGRGHRRSSRATA